MAGSPLCCCLIQRGDIPFLQNQFKQSRIKLPKPPDPLAVSCSACCWVTAESCFSTCRLLGGPPWIWAFSGPSCECLFSLLISNGWRLGRCLGQADVNLGPFLCSFLQAFCLVNFNEIINGFVVNLSFQIFLSLLKIGTIELH